MLYDQICMERDKIVSKMNHLRTTLKEMPNGHLICTKNGTHVKWYRSDGITPVYLSKKNMDLAEKLAAKKYYQYQFEELTQELNLLERYICHHNKIKVKSLSLLNESSYYKELLSSVFLPNKENLLQWSLQSYPHNTSYPENLVHQCLAGHKVRSKSEVIIANTLYLHKIPYRYEAGITLDDIQFFPDFTICHPKTFRTFYWEHFGMMDQPAYCDSSFNKLKIYAHHKIIPSINLITTYETQNHPIDSEKIEALIQKYFQ